jgi:polar amino acid transport system substrate-binding protein
VSRISPDIVNDLAPTGTLRAAINLGNPVLAQGDAAAPSGVTVDLARELARRAGLPLALVPFDAAGKVFDVLKAGPSDPKAWDIAFLAVEPVRAAEIAFTAPYVIIEGVYLVPKDSPLKSVAEVDRDGVRIGVNKASAYDLFLTRTLKRAQLVRGESGLDLFVAQKLDAAGGIKQPIVAYAKTHPEVRVMEGRFMEIKQAMGVPRGRDKAAALLHAFVEEMKASGFVADALKRAGQMDAAVAPAA